MTDFPHNDDAVFDRLVDGELSASERQQLLAALDDPQGAWQDQGWRRCATAFLEAQVWGHQFKQMIAEPTPETTQGVRQPQSTDSVFRAGHWFALAAGLLVAFSLGRFVQSPVVTSPQHSTIVATDPPIAERQELPLREDLPDPWADDAVTLLVRDTSGKDQRVQVPLMEVGDLDQQFGASLPAELRARLQDRGFDLQRRRRFAPMFFEQDQQLVPMVVPVDDTYVVPVNRPIY